MIKPDELAELLGVNKRQDAIKAIEEHFDKHIKQNALAGNTEFIIPTKVPKTNEQGLTESKFHYLWEMDHLSEDSAATVRHEVLDRYRKYGYFVNVSQKSNLPYEPYLAIKFKNLDITAKNLKNK